MCTGFGLCFNRNGRGFRVARKGRPILHMTATEERIIEIETLDAPSRDRSLTRIEQPEVEEKPRGGGWVMALCAALAVLWIAGCAAYLAGYAGLDALAASTPAQLAGLAFVAFGPALFLLVAGVAARQMARFSAEARLVAAAARRLTRPERLVEEEARTLSTTLAAEVARVNTGMDAALARLGAMEEVIKHHADSLAQAANRAGEQSRSLISDLRAERDALAQLADVLDAKAKSVADAIAEQSRMVARAAELAEGAAEEGKVRMESGARALETAATAVLTSSTQASGVLEAQRAKLDGLARTFADQGEGVLRLYETHREEMEEAGRTLREEQKRIASALDFHRAELGELVKVAGKGAADMTEATRSGGETLRKAVEDAMQQAQSLGDIIVSRTEGLAERQQERLTALDDAAQRARSASEAAIAAMDAQAASIDSKVEQLGESTFEAAARAERVLERRIEDAEKAIERVSRLAENADLALHERFEQSLETWREQLVHIEQRIDTVGQNLGTIPEAAREGVVELESAVRRGIEGLRAAARSAADEAREIDSALQARMRHNYELLSDFVLRMGSVAGSAPPRAAALPEPASPARPREPEAGPPRTAQPKFESGLSWRDIVSGLRETETPPSAHRDRAPTPAPAPAPPPAPVAAPEPEPVRDTAQSLGADPGALSAAAARDAAHARRSAGIDAMRESVREHATDHVSLLGRTIERDPDLRRRVRRLVDAQEVPVSSAAREEKPDRLIEILTTPDGRGYLLLSAALGGA